MSHRTQITLSDAQYERLRAESDRTGVSLAELVRRALDRTYATTGPDETTEALDASYGCWSERDYDGAAYVERLRRGMGERLADV